TVLTSHLFPYSVHREPRSFLQHRATDLYQKRSRHPHRRWARRTSLVRLSAAWFQSAAVSLARSESIPECGQRADEILRGRRGTPTDRRASLVPPTFAGTSHRRSARIFRRIGPRSHRASLIAYSLEKTNSACSA